MAKNIYFIGNGFDLHHLIHSRYRDYARWLCKNDIDLFIKIEDVYGKCDKDLWADFETQIGELDVEDYSARIYRDYRPNFGSDDFREADRYVPEMKAEEALNDLFLRIRRSFYKWVRQLSLANVLKKVEIDIYNSFFICFNYTDTLRRLYNIPQDKICYIHGNARKGDELVLGHGKTKDQLIEPTLMPSNLTEEQQQEWIDENITDDSFHRTVGATIDAVSNQRKEVERIIYHNDEAWNQMTQAQYFYIYGLSFSPIDTPYITKALSMMDKKNLSIVVNYYNQKDIEKINEYFHQLEFPEEKITLVQLKDLLVYKHLYNH